MDLDEFRDAMTNLMQARVGWAKAEAYARDVTDWMRRHDLEVVKCDGVHEARMENL